MLLQQMHFKQLHQLQFLKLEHMMTLKEKQLDLEIFNLKFLKTIMFQIEDTALNSHLSQQSLTK